MKTISGHCLVFGDNVNTGTIISVIVTGIDVTEYLAGRVGLPSVTTAHNLAYLQTKRDRMGHRLLAAFRPQGRLRDRKGAPQPENARLRQHRERLVQRSRPSTPEPRRHRRCWR